MSHNPHTNPISSHRTAPIPVPTPRLTRLNLFRRDSSLATHVRAFPHIPFSSHNPRSVEQVQNALNWRVRRYYDDQELVPGGTVVPRSSAEDIARRERQHSTRNASAVTEGSRGELMDECEFLFEEFRLEALDNVSRVLEEVTTKEEKMGGDKQEKEEGEKVDKEVVKVKERKAKQSRTEQPQHPKPDGDPNWTDDETVDESDTLNLPIKEDDTDMDFDMIGKADAEEFEVIEPFAVNGVAPNSRDGLRNARKYLGDEWGVW